jgi:MoaA/NifB/PqqE/SkfB family radical SAM enzyme
MLALNELCNRVHGGLHYRLRTLAGGRFREHCLPVTMMFLLTEHCNAHCIHCDIWKNTEVEETPTVECLRQTLSDLRAWLGPVQVTLTGGEALMKPYTPELVAHGSSLGLLMEVLSNGYWSDQRRIEALARANPWRVTLSLDGIGEVHDLIRGRRDFFAHTKSSIDTLVRMRREHGLKFNILLKTVVMRQNLDGLAGVARFADACGAEVLYQPIEQNYNREVDTKWFTTSNNWPADTAKATERVLHLVELKREGLPIANSYDNLRQMAEYFAYPERLQNSVQTHIVKADSSHCAGLTNFQVQANGDVRTCARRPSIGNIREQSIRTIWEQRPKYWEECCNG